MVERPHQPCPFESCGSMKTCTKCGELKNSSDYSPDKRKKTGLQSRCKVCCNEARAERYRCNPEVRLAKKLYDKDYIDKNREKKYKTNYRWNEANRDKIREKQRQRRKLYRHEAVAYARKRQISKQKRTPPWLTKEHLKEIKQFYWLAQDLKRVTGETYHVDHIVPLQGENVSGLHVPWNLQVLPADINVQKGNRFE